MIQHSKIIELKIHKYTNKYTNTQMHKDTHTYTHTHTHTNQQTNNRMPLFNPDKLVVYKRRGTSIYAY